MTHSSRRGLAYAAGSDPGTARSRNEDSVFASPRLLAVADGMGGHAHGEVASTAVIEVLTELDEQLRTADPGDVDPLPALHATVARALRRLTDLAARDLDLTLMGSTLTALLWDGTGFGLAHIGDSRGYLLREGTLHQITRDHTLVQSLVDEGRISTAEAAAHPRRSMLMRALQAGGSADPDLTPQPVSPGDRVLLCSDGVTCVIGPATIQAILTSAPTPADAVRQLIEEANRLHSPDNVSCVVADVTPTAHDGKPQIAGAATDPANARDDRGTGQPGTGQSGVTTRGPGWLPRWARQLLPG
jgi:serine/threonine protein phosphatase PrpC